MNKVCANCKHGNKNIGQRIPDVCKNCTVVDIVRGSDIEWIPSNWESAVEVTDNVNHPSHYATGKFECIDVMVETQGVEAVKSFCICNAFKYLYRHKNKNGIEDVKKAVFYLNKLVELEEENHDQT